MKVWIGIVIMMLSLSRLSAQFLAEYPMPQFVEESEIVVEGQVVNKSYFEDDRGMIYTRYHFDVSMIYKGEDRQLEFVEMGGIIGNRALNVCPSLSLDIGDKGVIGLRSLQLSTGETALIPVSSRSSWIAYESSNHAFFENEGHVYSSRKMQDTLEVLIGQSAERFHPIEKKRESPEAMVVINSISPMTTQAGTGQILTIQGSGFGSVRDSGFVLFKHADTPAPFYIEAMNYVSWSNTQIQVEVRTRAATGTVIVENDLGMRGFSPEPLEITYNVSNVGEQEHPYHHDFDQYNNGGYAFELSTNTNNGGVDITSIPLAMAALDRATTTWNQVTGFSIYTEEICGTTMIQVPVSDGTNVITFDNNVFDIDAVYGSSTLGVMFSYYGTCLGDWEVTEMDMVLRRNGNPNGYGGSVNWEYGPGFPSGGEIDFESVVLHELGHGHQLGHCLQPGAVMYPSISAGTTSRNLTVSETTGGGYIQNESTSFTPPVSPGCRYPFNQPRQYEAYDASNRCSVFLPLELLAFKSQKVGEHSIDLLWTTAYEIDHDRIVLQCIGPGHGEPGRWEDLSVHKKPESEIDGLNQYRFTHEALESGTYYYRLKIIDRQGNKEFSRILSEEIQGKEEDVQVNWHLHNGRLMMDFGQSEMGEVKLEVVAINGSVVSSESIQTAGNRCTHDLRDLNSGIYCIRWYSIKESVSGFFKVYLP